MSTLEFVRQWLSTIHDILPKSLYDALEAIYAGSASLRERYFGLSDVSFLDVFASLNFQAILPPLISILTIYFALLSLYRTTTFFVRSTIFLVKWGALIGTAGAALGYIANVVSPDSFGLFNQGNGATQRRRRNPSRSTRPRAWDSFDQHQRWRDGQVEDNPYAVDAGRAAREMVEKIVDATQQFASQGGWWSALTGIATKQILGDGLQAPGKEGHKPKDGRGKGKSR